MNQNIIHCNFFRTTINYNKCSYTLLCNDITITSNIFNEKKCYFSQFNSEYLFCCLIAEYIKCYRINPNNYKIIKVFNIQIIGTNSYLTIKNNSDYITIFFMNEYNIK